MAHFINQYIEAIHKCDDYDMLANELDICITKNIVNHIDIEIKAAIDRLEIITPIHNFMKSLVWAATVSDHTETSLNILRYFCNKVVKEFDSLTMELDDFSLMVITICADDKQFINRLTDEQKDTLITILSRFYLCMTDSDLDDPLLFNSLRTSMKLILEGKNMGELDKHFENLRKGIDINAAHTDKAHITNEIIRPFQALFINIIHNMDQPHLLLQISVYEWEDRLMTTMKATAKRFADASNVKNSYDSYYLFIHDFIYNSKWFMDELSKTGYENIVNPIVGQYISVFLEMVHQYYSMSDFTIKEVSMLLNASRGILFDNFSVADNAKRIINIITDDYISSPDHEEVFLKGEYFEAIKAHLNKDELFKIWSEGYKDNNNEALLDRVYATYVHCYINPDLEFADSLLESDDELSEIDYNPNQVIATEAVKKVKRIKEEDDEITDENGNRIKNNKDKKKKKKQEETIDDTEEDSNNDSNNDTENNDENEEANTNNEDEEVNDNETNEDEESSDNSDTKSKNVKNNKKVEADDEEEEDEEYDGPEIDAKQSTKGYKKISKVQSVNERKIYKSYKIYKNSEAKVDSQLSKMLTSAKRAFSGDKTAEIIEGKKFTPIGLLKKILVTAAIFNYSKVAGFVFLLVSHTLNKKRTIKQKNEILMQINEEIKMMDEKIDDARSDGNRKAKYALMRTKGELIRARDKIKYNLTATKQDMKSAKRYINNKYRDNLDNL